MCSTCARKSATWPWAASQAAWICLSVSVCCGLGFMSGRLSIRSLLLRQPRAEKAAALDPVGPDPEQLAIEPKLRVTLQDRFDHFLVLFVEDAVGSVDDRC